jgi:hypothetical protein
MVFLFIIYSILVTFVFVDNSFAYLDPGTGSFMIQMLLAGLLTVSFFVKGFWRKIKTWVKTVILRKKEN